MGQGLWHSARVLQSHGVELTEGEIIETLTAIVRDRINRGGLPWRPGARELLVELKEKERSERRSSPCRSAPDRERLVSRCHRLRRFRFCCRGG